MRILSVTALLFGVVLMATTAAPTDEPQIQELYRRGLKGDAAAVVQCIDKLEAVLQTEPGNQLARVYLGSAFTLRSRDLSFGPRKLQTLKRGVALMDEAVAAAPDNANVRLARALTTQALPSFLGRAESTRRDFTALAETAQRAPEKFEPGDRQIIYYYAGLAAKRAGERDHAATLWQLALRSPADPALTARTEAELAKL